MDDRGPVAASPQRGAQQRGAQQRAGQPPSGRRPPSAKQAPSPRARSEQPAPSGQPSSTRAASSTRAPASTREPTAARRPEPTPASTPVPELLPEPKGRFNRLLVAPFTEGPRVRMGALWFFLTLAAATSGRWWTAVLWSAAAAFAAAQTVGAWQDEYRADEHAAEAGSWTESSVLRWIAGAAAAIGPMAAGYGTGLAGAALGLLALGCGATQLVRRTPDTGVVSIAVLLSTIAASAVVVAVRIDLWAGLFLILAVSLYDAGSYLMGAEAAGRWEGPVAGVIGALAVTFTIATVDPPPFDRVSAWLTGVLVAGACVLGQWTASAFLPRTTARAPALRRLDAYIVAAPVFVGCAWLLGS